MPTAQKNDATLALGDAVSRSHTTTGEYTPADLISRSRARGPANRFLWATDTVRVALAEQGWRIDRRKTEHGTHPEYVVDAAGDDLAKVSGPRTEQTFTFLKRATVTRAGGETDTFEPGAPVDAVSLFAGVYGFDEGRVIADAADALAADEAKEKGDDVAERVRKLDADAEAKHIVAERERENLTKLTGTTPGGSWEGATDAQAELAKKIMAGDFDAPAPAYLTRADSTDDNPVAMLYPGRTHSIFGESGIGKSWVALALTKQVLSAGGRVLFLDYEDTYAGCLGRLKTLGIRSGDLDGLTYRGPLGDDDPGETDLTLEHPHPPKHSHGHDFDVYSRYLALLDADDYDVVIIDGVQSAITTARYDSNLDKDVIQWYAELPEFIAHRTTAAVLMIDHIAKNALNKGYAIGSNAKKTRVTGASFRADEAPAGRDELRLDLYAVKDRFHGVEVHCDDDDLFGQLHLSPNPPFGSPAGTPTDQRRASILTPAEARRGAARAAEVERLESAGAADRILSEGAHAGLSNTKVVAAAAAYLFPNDNQKFTYSTFSTQAKKEMPATFDKNFRLKASFGRAVEQKMIAAKGNSHTVKLDQFDDEAAAVVTRLQSIDPDADDPGKGDQLPAGFGTAN